MDGLMDDRPPFSHFGLSNEGFAQPHQSMTFGFPPRSMAFLGHLFSIFLRFLGFFRNFFFKGIFLGTHLQRNVLASDRYLGLERRIMLEPRGPLVNLISLSSLMR